MSTTIAPRPPAEADRRVGGTGPAITRLARRTARGQGRRRVLVLVVIAVAVAAGVSAGALTATLARNDVERGPVDRFGAADLLVESFRDLYEEEPQVILTPAQQTWLDEHPVAVDPALGTDLGQPGPSDVAVVSVEDVLASLPVGARSLVSRMNAQLGQKSYGSEAFVTDMDLSHPLVGDTFAFEGPARTLVGDEAMVSPGYLADLGAAVGDTIPVPRVGEVTVVGTVTRSLQRSQRVVVVAPGRELGNLLYLEQVRVGLPEGADVSTQRNAIGEALTVRADELRAELPDSQDSYVEVGSVESQDDFRTGLGDPTGVATLVAGVTSGLAAVMAGILAACAFAVGVRRRIRQIGMLGAVGADPAQLARLLRREGLLLGIGGAVLGTVLGVVISVVGLPVVERVGDRELTLTLPLMAVLLPLVLGAVAAMAAAAWPARTAARVPVVQALAGRVPLGRLPAWVAGLVTGVLGVLLLAGVANGSAALGSGLDALLAVAGSMLATLGTAAAGLPLLASGARVADRLPFLPRMAVRDSARQRSRSGVAVAALIPVLAMPVAAFTTWTSAVNSFAGDVSSYVAPEPGPWAMLSGPYAGNGRFVPPSVEDVAAARRVLPPSEIVADVVQLGDPQWPDVRFSWRQPEGPEVSGGSDGFEVPSAPITLATPQLLAALGLDANAMNGAEVLLLAGAGGYPPPPDGVVRVVDPFGEGGETTPVIQLRAEVDETWVGGGVPVALVAPETAAELGLVEVQRLTLLSLSRPLTSAEVASLYGGESGLPDTVYVDTVGEPPFLDTPLGHAVMWALVVLGVVLVVSIVAVMTASLAATESDDDIRKLVALGADPAARRRFHGLQAGWHTLVAVVLAVPLGLAVAAAAIGWRDIDVPWLASLAWIVGVPVLVGLCIAAVLRSAPVGAPRRRMA